MMVVRARCTGRLEEICGQGWVLMKDITELSQTLEAVCIPGLIAPFSTVKPSRQCLDPSVCLLLLPILSFEETCSYPEPQNNAGYSKSQSFTACVCACMWGQSQVLFLKSYVLFVIV